MLRNFFIVLTACVIVMTSACKAQSPFADIDAKIAQHLNDGTEYAIYLAYPTKTSEAFIYNSKPMRSASMIKVFILACVMDKTKHGELDLDETIVLRSSDKVGGAGILAGYASGTN